MKNAALGTIVESFSSIRVLVVGDVMLDRFQYGCVERISPEAPVPVFKPTRIVEMPGGAGNTAVNLSCLGCDVSLVARTGMDKTSKLLQRIFKERGVATEFFRQSDYDTAIKTRLIAGNNHILRMDDEKIIELDSKQSKFMGDLIQDMIAEHDIVILSDYGKGFLSYDLTTRIIEYCHTVGKSVIVDPKGTDYGKYVGATLVKPNLKEFSSVAGMRFDPNNEKFRANLIDAAKVVLKRYRIGGILITLGEHGMLYVQSGGRKGNSVYLPTRAREVFDVSGAGDTTIAVLSAALGVGATMSEAMQIANAAAGVVVGKLGTAMVTVNELMTALSDLCDDPLRKLLPIDRLVREIEVLKKDGKIIGFTNGCFDCCHLGHLTSLREARRLCDVLVVGVNSDAWIRNHKGKTRPLQNEVTRVSLLASLEYVDFVVVFDDETALPLVKRLRPHIIAKEGYALKDWPEGRFVKSIGGKAVTLRRVDGYSTTALAERMREP